MRGTSPSHAVIWVAMVLFGSHGPAIPPPADVTGRISIAERGNKSATDVAQAVIWLEGTGARPAPRTVAISTEGKEFRPRVVVVPAGSTVNFPNNDPFNHNVFSLSDEGPFDLGLYGRGQAKSTRFNRAGVIRVYCNVHASMAAFVYVMDNPWFAQPSGDGSFVVPAVPAGKYKVHVWHERTPELVRDIEVGPQGLGNLELQLDARGYQFVQHLNKFGQPYSKGGARY